MSRVEGLVASLLHLDRQGPLPLHDEHGRGQGLRGSSQGPKSEVHDGTVMYMMVHKSDIGRPVKEILRLVQAFRHSDLTGEALAASGWIPGGEVIPTDFCKKVKNFVNKFGHGIKMLLRQQRLKHRLKMKQLLQNRKKIKPNPKMRSLMLSLKKLLMKFKTLKIL